MKPPLAFLSLGFRPFFLLASLYAMIGMGIWLVLYTRPVSLLHPAVSAMDWHAHEMLFGYAVGVIAGFLLTAVRNWTSQPTPSGMPLLLLAGLWLMPRLLLLTPLEFPLWLIASLDCLFLACLLLAIGRPIFRARQWRHMGIFSKVFLMLVSNGLFYAGVMRDSPQLVDVGVYSGLYMIVALVLTMVRRLIPFFVERALSVELKTRDWLDRSSLVFFLAFWIAVVFFPGLGLDKLLAAVLLVLHSIRLWDWYTGKIWSKPLLWILYLAYATLLLGFALKAAESLVPMSPYLSVHAFAFGGIGIMTIGMMARVAWGHTGRNLNAMPSVLLPCFLLMVAGGILRVLFPWLWPEHHVNWVIASGACWIFSFALFAWVYTPVLVRPRVDAA